MILKNEENNMFREMRRSAQQLSEEECIAILNKCTNGVLSVNGDDGYPYGVPVSYAFQNGKIYIHGAKTGHKIDALKRSDKVTFTVIEMDDILPKKFTTVYRSVIVFAKARIMSDVNELIDVLTMLGHKYSPGYEKQLPHEIETSLKSVSCIELTIEHMTGKQGKELLRK